MENFLNRTYNDIFVDFDNTMYLWDNIPKIEEKTEDHLDWLAKSLDKTGNQFDPNRINQVLTKYLMNQKAKGTKIHLSTWVTYSNEGEAKFNFLNKNCYNLFDDWFAVSSNEAKIDVALIFARQIAKNNLDHNVILACRNNILIIDDNINVMETCYKYKINAQYPQFIMNEYINTYMN